MSISPEPESRDLVSTVGARVNADAGFPGACVNSRKVFLSNHALADGRVDPSVRRRGIQSLIAVPMVENGEVLGYFEVFSRTENALKPHRFPAVHGEPGGSGAFAIPTGEEKRRSTVSSCCGRRER